MTKSEEILEALKAKFKAGLPLSEVLRNEVIPVDITEQGLIIIRDGDPGDPDQVLGGFGSCYYEHRVEIEIFVQHADPELRDRKYNAFIVSIGECLSDDETLGGLADGMTYGNPSPNTDYIEGGEDIKSATLAVVIEYYTAKPLS